MTSLPQVKILLKRNGLQSEMSANICLFIHYDLAQFWDTPVTDYFDNATRATLDS